MEDGFPNGAPARHAEALLAAIVASSDDPIISKNLDGIISSWNKGAERLFGYTAEEAIGKPVLLIIPPDHEHEESMILARLRAGERIDHYETVRRAKDGRLINVSLTVSPISDEHGRIVGASKVARNISERKQLERARELFNQQLEEQADQLRRLARELTSAEQRERRRVAELLHDGLAQVLAIAKLELDTVPASEAIKHVNDYLVQAIHYTRGLMNDLSPAILKDRDMAAALSWLASDFDKRYGLKVEVSDVQIESEPPQESALFLFSALRELLVNVVKHAETKYAAVSFHISSGKAIASVRDWGSGFDFQARSARTEAGGFGLSNSRDRIEVLNGSMRIESAPGEGTVVSLELPLTDSKNEVAAPRVLEQEASGLHQTSRHPSQGERPDRR